MQYVGPGIHVLKEWSICVMSLKPTMLCPPVSFSINKTLWVKVSLKLSYVLLHLLSRKYFMVTRTAFKITWCDKCTFEGKRMSWHQLLVNFTVSSTIMNIHATNVLLIWIFLFLISLLNPFALISKVGYLLVFLQPVISDPSCIEACCDKTRYFCLGMHFFPLLDGAYNLPSAIPWTYAVITTHFVTMFVSSVWHKTAGRVGKPAA